MSTISVQTMSSLLKITSQLLLIVGLMLQGFAASPSKTPEWDPRRGKLIFEDNFDTLNTSTWLHLITSWRGGENVPYFFYFNPTWLPVFVRQFFFQHVAISILHEPHRK